GRLEAAEHDVRVLRHDQIETGRHMGAVEDALADARLQLAQMRSSTSWRITAPVRAITRLLRRRPPTQVTVVTDDGDTPSATQRTDDR
ncbi:MAG TPA: hypothetical protein VMV14_09245, partial [Acidimicrobiales bacterium]|nr:hypothetical protein [Acidimicrobiales bacterium]